MFSRAIFSLALIGLSSPVAAVPVKWDLSNIYVETPYSPWYEETVGGYFVYDAAAGSLLEVNTTWPVEVFRVYPEASDGTRPNLDSLTFGTYKVAYYTYEREFEIYFKTPLPDAGGTVDVEYQTYYYLTSWTTGAEYYDPVFYYSNFLGYATGTPVPDYVRPIVIESQDPGSLSAVPLPASLPMLIAGFAGLAMLRRSKRRDRG